MNYFEYVFDAVMPTVVLFGIMGSGVVVLCVIGKLLSDGSDDK